jgi:DNA-binding SARP family transcriptional activator
VRLDVELLGRFRVRVDGRPVPDDAWQHRRAAELVKLLALAPEHRLTAEQVIDTLWPALSPAAGAANLRKAAHLARRALEAADLVLLRGGTVVLAAAADVRTDVEAFEAASAAALLAGDPEAALSACRLYRGELLPDDRYEPWAEEPRERLRRRYLDLLRKAKLWQRVVDLEPLDEEANRALMSAFATAGNRHAALRQFARLRDRLAGELGLRPSEETVALYEEIRLGPAAVAPVAAESPLVGREAELDRALAAWEAASLGRGGALLVTGEAGIGKTRFCEELLTRAAASGWTTLRGAARIEEGRAPFAPIAEALDRLLLSRPDLAARLTAAAQREVARLTPALASTGAGDPASSRERLFAAVAQLLAAAARERGAVLLVDDAHAADEATLQLLHYVVRRARFQRLLVVVSYRSRGEHVAQTAASLLEQRLATRIDLGPLTRDDSFELIERTGGIRPPAETAATIWELAAGNPFYTQELASHVGADGSLRVPSQLHEIVLARVEALGRDARHGLARAAVLGAEFTADEFVAVSGLAEELAFDSLDVALAAGVVEEREAGYRFRHVLTRDALEESLPAHRRRVAHRKAAECLAEGRAQPVRVAHHLLRAGDEREAVPWLEEAARRALALGALADASRVAEDALAFADEARRPAILELRGDILFARGAPEAATAYGDALAQVRGSTRRRLRIKQARAYLAAGAVDAASEAVAGPEASTADERLALLLARG